MQSPGNHGIMTETKPEIIVFVEELYCERCDEVIEPWIFGEGHILKTGPNRALDLCLGCMSKELEKMMKE